MNITIVSSASYPAGFSHLTRFYRHRSLILFDFLYAVRFGVYIGDLYILI